jgi:CheY-like chemotaxis protein
MTTTEPKLRVLIVDDNRDGADALGLVVEALGHQVHVTYGVSQAIDVATAFRPDLMLIDLAMPDMDGCHLVKHFRQLPSPRSLRSPAMPTRATKPWQRRQGLMPFSPSRFR